jgi:hypothetical protein
MDKVRTGSTNIKNILITTYLHNNGYFHASAECVYDGTTEIAISDVFISKDDAIKDAINKLAFKCVPIIEFIDEEEIANDSK